MESLPFDKLLSVCPVTSAVGITSGCTKREVAAITQRTQPKTVVVKEKIADTRFQQVFILISQTSLVTKKNDFHQYRTEKVVKQILFLKKNCIHSKLSEEKVDVGAMRLNWSR